MVLADLPLLIAAGWWGYSAWQAERQRRADELARQICSHEVLGLVSSRETDLGRFRRRT